MLNLQPTAATHQRNQHLPQKQVYRVHNKGVCNGTWRDGRAHETAYTTRLLSRIYFTNKNYYPEMDTS